MRRAVRPRLATGNEPRMQMNSRATSIPQRQGGWFRRLKKRQPITARRVDEMEVRLPLEESLCPHRSSSSAFSTGVSSSTPCCILPLSRHLHPRSASFYFYFHPLCTVLPPLPYRIADRVVSVALLATAYILSRGPAVPPRIFVALGPPLPSASRRNSLSRKKEPAKNRCLPPIGRVAGGLRLHWRSSPRGRGLKMSSRYVIAYIDPIVGQPDCGEQPGVCGVGALAHTTTRRDPHARPSTRPSSTRRAFHFRFHAHLSEERRQPASSPPRFYAWNAAPGV